MRSVESIYYVLSWLCHRQCPHCYEERFRPYRGDALAEVVGGVKDRFSRIIAHFPDTMRYEDPAAAAPGERVPVRTGRIILSGGEVLVPQVRESILYPAIEQIVDRYRASGGVNVVVQTTGDLLTPPIVDELLARGVWMISVSGLDDFHAGMTPARREALEADLTRVFERVGMIRSGSRAGERRWQDEAGPVFSFFGATPDSWIGKIWPRGRAWANGLSEATLSDNFCNAWSGGLNFLNLGRAGSEVSIEPDGAVYPCCMKTRVPLGNLVEEPLMDILSSLIGHPVFEAITMGHPERMGLSQGWSVERFLEASRTRTPKGRPYQNLCIGCDRFHEELLGPVLAALRGERLARRRPGADIP